MVTSLIPDLISKIYDFTILERQKTKDFGQNFDLLATVEGSADHHVSKLHEFYGADLN